MNPICRPFLYLALAILCSVPTYAKRVPPRPIAHVVANGIEYSVDSDGKTGYVVATNPSNSKELWRVKLYHVHVKFWVEEDVQWVYFTNLKLVGDTLLARDEMNRCYSVDIRTKKHIKRSCGNEFTPSNSR